MPVCKKCDAPFPNRMVIDGKRKVLGNRKYCLTCSPYNVHNTRQLEKEEREPPTCRCVKCGREYLYDKKKGHTLSHCNSCRASLRHRKTKRRAIEYLGGKCQLCEYDLCDSAMDFHHRDPSKKEFAIGGAYNRAWEEFRKELDKCVLLCCRCHREVSAGVRTIDMGA